MSRRTTTRRTPSGHNTRRGRVRESWKGAPCSAYLVLITAVEYGAAFRMDDASAGVVCRNCKLPCSLAGLERTEALSVNRACGTV